MNSNQDEILVTYVVHQERLCLRIRCFFVRDGVARGIRSNQTYFLSRIRVVCQCHRKVTFHMDGRKKMWIGICNFVCTSRPIIGDSNRVFASFIYSLPNGSFRLTAHKASIELVCEFAITIMSSVSSFRPRARKTNDFMQLDLLAFTKIASTI